MKEFEAKKQKIIIHIEELQRCDRLQEKVNSTSLAKNVKELQPPKPICSTCDHCEHHEIDCGEGMLSDCYRCVSDKIDWNMLPYIEEPAYFGCIHHSLYGATNG